MATQLQRLIQSAPVQATTTNLYSSPGATKTQISTLSLTNSDSADAHEVTIYTTPSDSSPQPEDIFLKKVLAPDEIWQAFPFTNMVLPATGSLWFSTDEADLVFVNASGKLVTE